jgi:hypothetical protein
MSQGVHNKFAIYRLLLKLFKKNINGKEYNFYSVFYPVGNGRFNIDKSIEDIKWIIKEHVK